MTVPPPNSRRTFSRLQLHRDLHYQASAILVRSVCEGALSAARWAIITPLFRSNDAATPRAPGIKAPCASTEGSDVKETAG